MDAPQIPVTKVPSQVFGEGNERRIADSMIPGSVSNSVKICGAAELLAARDLQHHRDQTL